MPFSFTMPGPTVWKHPMRPASRARLFFPAAPPRARSRSFQAPSNRQIGVNIQTTRDKSTMQHPHTVEKIGGTSMSRSHELLDTIFKRKDSELYNRVFVVSAYAGMTDLLLEHKQSGEAGVYGLFASAEGGSQW